MGSRKNMQVLKKEGIVNELIEWLKCDHFENFKLKYKDIILNL